MRGKVLIFILVLLVLGSGGVAYYFYDQNQKLIKDPNGQAKSEAVTLVKTVGKLIELPTGEDPTVATVADEQKLKDQTFFANAVNGDKILIYTQAKEAILYRPSTNKIIEVGPVNINPTDQTTTTTPTASATPTATTIPKK